MIHKNKAWVLSLSMPFLLSSCSLPLEGKLIVTDAKIVTAVDEKLNPVKVTNIFSEGVSKVFCWFQWRNAKVNTEVTARWHYITDDIHILDYTFNLPRTEGQGGVALSMPADKKLPSGLYRIDLATPEHTLRSLNFKIE